jgi:hypothetical protein
MSRLLYPTPLSIVSNPAAVGFRANRVMAPSEQSSSKQPRHSIDLGVKARKVRVAFSRDSATQLARVLYTCRYTWCVVDHVYHTPDSRDLLPCMRPVVGSYNHQDAAVHDGIRRCSRKILTTAAGSLGR